MARIQFCSYFMLSLMFLLTVCSGIPLNGHLGIMLKIYHFFPMMMGQRLLNSILDLQFMIKPTKQYL